MSHLRGRDNLETTRAPAPAASVSMASRFSNPLNERSSGTLNHDPWVLERRLDVGPGRPHPGSAGHSAEAPTLLGADPGGAQFPSQPITAWADQIAARVREAEGPVVLVAQSRGGLIISEVAERIPERVGYLVYAAAFLLPNGATVGGTIQSAHPSAAPIFSVDPATGMTTVLPEALERIYSRTLRAGSKLRAQTSASSPLQRSQPQSRSAMRGSARCGEPTSKQQRIRSCRCRSSARCRRGCRAILSSPSSPTMYCRLRLLRNWLGTSLRSPTRVDRLPP